MVLSSKNAPDNEFDFVDVLGLVMEGTLVEMKVHVLVFVVVLDLVLVLFVVVVVVVVGGGAMRTVETKSLSWSS